MTAIHPAHRHLSSRIGTLVLHVSLWSLLALILQGCAIAPQPALKANETATSQRPKATVSPASQQSSDVIDRATSKPFSGSLSTFEDAKRADNLQVGRVMDLLGIKEGSNVADVGAGSGWFTVLAARRVGSGGTVYAVEINRDFLKHIENRAKREKLDNIRPVLSKPDDPLLPKKSVEAVLLLKTYHEVEQPVRLLKRIREAMRADALLGIIDRGGNGEDHGIDQEVVVKEAERAGFVLVGQHDFVKPDNVDYFLIFRSK